MLHAKDLESDGEAFDAALFYAILRADGCNPVVRDGALYVELHPVAEAVARWAALHDPTCAVRLAYARSAWASRAADVDTVELGCIEL